MGTKILQSDLARDALYTKVNQIGDEKVDLESDQTVTGRKTFTDRVYTNAEVVYINNVTKGTAPSSVQYGNIYMVDSTKSWGDLYALGRFVTSVNSDSSVVSQIMAYKNEANSNIYGYIRMTYDTDNNQYFASIGGSSSGTNWSATRETNSTGINTIPTMGWVNNPATSTNVVHRTGNETIGGSKTFTSDVSIANDNPYIELHDNDFVKGNLPSSEPVYAIYVQDKTSGISQSNRLGLFTTHVQTNGTTVTWMTAYKNVANSTDSASIRIYYPTSGNPYTYAPTPTDTTTTSGTQMATTGWVNTTGNNVVHRTDNETIAGTKTFSSTISGSITGNAGTVTNGVYTTGNQTIGGTKTFSSTISGSITGNAGTVTNGVYTTGNQTIAGTKTFSGDLVVSKSGAGTVLKNTAQTKGTAPSGDLWSAVEWQDSAGKTMARIRQRYTSAKTNFIDIMCYKANSSSDTTSTSLQVVYPASGDPYMNGVTPAVSDSSTKLATTAYINNKFKKVSTLPASPDANTFYFIPE